MRKLRDSERIRRIRGGEKELLNELFEQYYDEIFRYCMCLTGEREAAYDCTQDTFLKLLRYLDSYQEQEKFKSWLYRIARTTCMDYFRRQKNRGFLGELLEEPPVEESGFKRLEEKDQVERALKALSMEQREVVVLFYYNECKLREIAKVLDVPLSTVKSRMKQAREKLRSFMGEEESL